MLAFIFFFKSFSQSPLFLKILIKLLIIFFIVILLLLYSQINYYSTFYLGYFLVSRFVTYCKLFVIIIVICVLSSFLQWGYYRQYISIEFPLLVLTCILGTL